MRGIYSREQTITINIEALPEEESVADEVDEAAAVDVDLDSNKDNSNIGLKFAEQLRNKKEKERLIALGVDPEKIEVPTAELKRVTSEGLATVQFSLEMKISQRLRQAQQGGSVTFEGDSKPVPIDEIL